MPQRSFRQLGVSAPVVEALAARSIETPFTIQRLVVPDAGLHRPWLQFFPGFEWVTARGVIIGLVWTQVYAWYTALAFGSLFHFFAARSS